MKTEFFTIELNNPKRDFININDKVKECVKKSGIKNGFCIVFTQHTTGAVKVHEWETEKNRDLIIDSLDFLERVAPTQQNYGHDKASVDDRPNTHSHLKALLLNSGEVIPIKDGELLLGQWQAIYFVELDPPRPSRKVIVEIMGE